MRLLDATQPAIGRTLVSISAFLALACACGGGAGRDDQAGRAPSDTTSASAAAGRSWQPPPGFEEVPIPADNPMTPEKVALGEQLFFDQRLSGDGTRSCYSCHVCEHGLTDGLPTAVGSFGKKLPRSSPTLWNIGYHKEFYWDGRSPSLEAQGLAAWKGGNMGANPDSIAAVLNQIAAYREQFQRVFKTDVTADGIMKAIAAYERTILCGNTAFDRWQQGEKTAISARAQQGWELFYGKAACATCHVGYLFTDLLYHNVGIGIDKEKPDIGRNLVSKEDQELGAFKTPTLRDITRSGPYFHDGSVSTLEEAVKLMASGGKENPHRDPRLEAVNLTADEMGALLEFLTTLECPCDVKAPPLP